MSFILYSNIVGECLYILEISMVYDYVYDFNMKVMSFSISLHNEISIKKYSFSQQRCMWKITTDTNLVTLTHFHTFGSIVRVNP